MTKLRTRDHAAGPICGKDHTRASCKPLTERAVPLSHKGNLATIGRSVAVADLGRFRFNGWLGWIAWALVHIAYLISFRNRVLVLTQWAYNYFTFERGARLITDQPGASSDEESRKWSRVA